MYYFYKISETTKVYYTFIYIYILYYIYFIILYIMIFNLFLVKGIYPVVGHAHQIMKHRINAN